MTHMQIPGKAVLITGAASGIGRACAVALHQRGAQVVLCDLDQGALDELATQLGSSALAVSADVTDLATLQRAVDRGLQAFGRLDVVLANAGIAVDPPMTVAGMADGDFERVLDVNLTGVWRTVRATLPAILDAGGHVLMTASIYAYVNGLVNSPYAAAKAGVEQLARALRAELAGRGATAGVLYPGWVRTPIARSALDRTGVAGKLVERAYPSLMRQAVTPERVAQAVVDGVERRAAEIHVPRRWRPISVLRGVVNPVVEARLQRDPEIHRLLRQLEQGAGPTAP